MVIVVIIVYVGVFVDVVIPGDVKINEVIDVVDDVDITEDVASLVYPFSPPLLTLSTISRPLSLRLL